MNARRRNAVIVIVGLSALLLLAVIGGRARHSEAAPVRTQVISYGRFVTKLPENGVVQRPRTLTIAAQVAGNIGTIAVRAGERVAAGQLLATIENPQLYSNAATSSAAYRAALAHAQSAAATGRTGIVQAQANVQSARARLTQAQQDLANGSQSGLGYGASSAGDQRLQADAALATAQTNLNEARRIYTANANLYANQAIARDQLEQSKAKYDQAQIAYDQTRRQRQSLSGQLSRTQQVLRDNARSAQEGYAQALAQLDAARLQSGSGDVAAAYADAARAGSEYSFAQDQAARTQLRAPFSGMVLSVATETGDSLRPVQPGDPVQLGQSLFTLSADDAFVVRTKVDEQDIINVRPGQRAQITGEDFPGRVLFGHVAAISPIAQKSDDPSSTARQIITTIRLDRSPGFLRDGMSVDVDLLTTDLAHAIVVGNDAIVREHGKAFVYVVTGGTAHKRRVRTGQANDTKTIIVAGLHPGERIVAQKPADLEDGAAVSVAASPSPSAR